MIVLAKLLTHDGFPAVRDLAPFRHLLIVAPAGTPLQQLPLHATLGQALQRRRKKAADLAKAPLAAETADGALAVWVLPDPRQTVFEQHTLLRKALAPLLAEAPESIGIVVLGRAAVRRLLGERAAYVASVNAVQLPQRKKAPAAKPLQRIELWGGVAPQALAPPRAVAEGNALCRTLTVTAPNELTPREYRRRLRALARGQGWGIEEYDFSRLKRMGAGAFCAVAQGSDEKDAAIVRLRYRPRGAKRTVALVGKGICFDTGGHNLKPARYMQGMHEDMNGSAVALGILHAATQARLPVNIDCWLALAQNHLSPRAYKQNDIGLRNQITLITCRTIGAHEIAHNSNC